MDRELLRIYQALILDRFSFRSAIKSYQRQRKLHGSNNYRVDRMFLDGSRICREAIETNSKKLCGSRLH